MLIYTINLCARAHGEVKLSVGFFYTEKLKRPGEVQREYIMFRYISGLTESENGNFLYNKYGRQLSF